MFSISSASPGSKQAGFSLLELLVSIGIIVLVLSIVVARQGAFNSAVLLRSEAYDIALTMREVQLSAVSAQSNSVGDFSNVRGLYMDVTSPQEYVVFDDNLATPNYFYDAADLEETFIGQIDPRFEIKGIRADGVALVSSDVSIVFQRPNFDARFFDAGGSELGVTTLEIDVGPVSISGGSCPEGIRTIQVTSTGQISVLEC